MLSDIIENIPDWMRITGLSLPFILFFLFFLQAHGEDDAIRLPAEIDAAKEEASNEAMMAAHVAGNEAYKEFREIGAEEAERIKDPRTARLVELCWGIAGFFFYALLIFTMGQAVVKAFGG
ncbi:MAG: hypothetical protein ABIC95_02885 [archaeon]